ncbi:MAG: hypothetical protein RIM99_03290 [Cyclobacteriaceae bacterium]
MQDNLKDLIEANSEEFEIYPFDSTKGWGEIVDEIVPVKKRRNYWPFGIAASLAIVFISTVLVVSSTSEQAPGEVAEMEGFYQKAINEKIMLVKDQIKDERILNDLESMDEAFAELKSDLDENVDNEEVVMAMMENYRLKLQILEEILNELEKEK